MKQVDLIEEVSGNSYPGRGIVVGQSEDGASAVVAYFIMGRSVNSRNRVFIEEGEGIRTQAHDPALLSDPSLVIYAPVRVFQGKTIVTNGDQTDTVWDFVQRGGSFEEALRTRTFEPDAPNYTPRISAIVSLQEAGFSYTMSILKTEDGDPETALRQFFEYHNQAGSGHFLHTYACDGNPRIPSFDGEPTPVAIKGAIDGFTENLWEALHAENKVSLFVRYISLKTGKTETRIVNKNQ